MSQLIQFQNSELGKIKIYDKDGEAWFVANDVCKILGYSNPRKAIADHVDEDDKNTVTIRDGNKGNPNQVVINESGLYALILRSNKPEAKKFKKWVTSEVLPSIRKSGYYSLQEPRALFEKCLRTEYERGYKDGLKSIEDKIREARYEGAMAFEKLYLTSQRSQLKIDQDWLLRLKKYTMLGLKRAEIQKLLNCSRHTVTKYQKLMRASGLLPDKRQNLPALPESSKKGLFH